MPSKIPNAQESQEEDEEKDSFRPLYIFFATVIVLWLVALFVLISFPFDARGTFGDMFGGVNALFSGLALAGIIFTILLQKKELSLQRKELRETRKEFTTQNETLRLQRFENTLFQLINLHHEIIDHLSFNDEGSIRAKREVFSRLVWGVSWEFRNAKEKIKMHDNPNTQLVKAQINDQETAYSFLIQGYTKVYFGEFRQLLSNYYRNIYHIFKYIKTSELISDSDRKFYASIVRAQLSSEESFLILYNSLVPGLGHPNFLYLIRELDIMQNFDRSLIDEFKFHNEIYDQELKRVKPFF